MTATIIDMCAEHFTGKCPTCGARCPCEAEVCIAQLEAELAAAKLRVEELEGAADWGRAENERLAAELASEKLANGRLHVEVGDQGEKIRRLEAALRGEQMCDGCAGKADNPDCGCKGTGLMSEMVVSLREAALIDQPERIRRLEAALGAMMQERDLAIAHDRQPYPTAHAYEVVCARLAERDAALAAAHEALRAAHDWLSLFLEHAPIQFGGEEKVDRAISAALSAPALQRAAEELRLLREMEAADAATDAAVEGYLSSHGSAEAVYSTAKDKDAALANLRRFREEKP